MRVSAGFAASVDHITWQQLKRSIVLYLVPVLWDQVVISQLVQKYAGVFHARHLVFVTVEKLQQVFIFQKINRVHRQIFWENKPVYFQDGLLSNRQSVKS